MQLAPALLELEQSVKSLLANRAVDSDVLMAQFARTRAFINESVGLFREVEDTLVTDDEGRQKLELCAQEMDFSLQALQKLQDAAMGGKQLILKERLQSFLTSRIRCLEYFAEFSRQAQNQPIYSPVPAYDSFIKAGVKVLEKQLPQDRLRERFPSLMPELHKVERLVALLPKLHEIPDDLASGLNQGLQGLRTGYGALAIFFEQEDSQALEDGLKLIGSSSSVLNQQLQKAEELASSSVRYSTFRPLEEWLRLRAYMALNPTDEIPDAWVTEQVSQIFYIWDFVLSQAQNLLNNPLLSDAEVADGVTQDLLSACLESRGEANEKLATLRGPELLSSPDELWLSLTKSVEDLQRAVEVSLKAMAEYMAPYRELPGLEVIVGLKEQVKRGEVSKSVLADEFHKQLEKVEELIKSVEHANDPISREFYDLLPLHRSAFIGMLENLEQDDWHGLDSRWQGIVSTLPHLANLSRAIRTRLASQGSAAKLVRCMRCGANNEPTRRVCSSCGANLPAVIQKMQTFSEINTDQQEGGQTVTTVSPRAIDLLENMVDGLDRNVTSRKDASEALSLLIADVDRQRKLFSQKLLPLMGKDDVLDSYLRYFAQGLSQYFADLMEMHTAVGQGDLHKLHAAFAQTRETLQTLDAMKERVDGALRG